MIHKLSKQALLAAAQAAREWPAKKLCQYNWYSQTNENIFEFNAVPQDEIPKTAEYG